MDLGARSYGAFFADVRAGGQNFPGAVTRQQPWGLRTLRLDARRQTFSRILTIDTLDNVMHRQLAECITRKEKISSVLQLRN